MPQLLTPQQEQLLALLAEHADSNGRFSFEQLRAAGVPEKARSIFRSRAAVLDALLTRKILELYHCGYLAMTLRGGDYSIIKRA